MMNPSPNSEERTWAVISHLSVLALGMGIPLPIVGWSDQRRKSQYAAFQCLQALGYQSLIYTFWLMALIVLLILSLVVLLLATGAAADRVNIAAWSIILAVLAAGLFLLYLLFPLLAAVACAFGRDYRYPILGKRLAKHLGYGMPNDREEPSSMNEEREAQWVAAMGHFSVIIFLWGLLAPLTSWMVQGRRNAFLKFQSIQTTIYQIIVNILFLVMSLIFWLGTIPVLILQSQMGASNSNSEAVMAAFALFFVFLLIGLVMLLVLPAFHILGEVAGYRVLKGKNYHYPIIGKLVEKRMANSDGVRAESRLTP